MVVEVAAAPARSSRGPDAGPKERGELGVVVRLKHRLEDPNTSEKSRGRVPPWLEKREQLRLVHLAAARAAAAAAGWA